MILIGQLGFSFLFINRIAFVFYEIGQHFSAFIMIFNGNVTIVLKLNVQIQIIDIFHIRPNENNCTIANWRFGVRVSQNSNFPQDIPNIRDSSEIRATFFLTSNYTQSCGLEATF